MSLSYFFKTKTSGFIEVSIPIHSEWNNLYIELNNQPNEDSVFKLNEDSKTFKSYGNKQTDDTLYLGGWKGKNHFHGAIGRF